VRYILVALAGALGAVARYSIGRAVGVTRFPWATLAINLSGSFVLAAVFTTVVHRRVSADLATAISVGFLGAYTTFSTFAWETYDMGRTDRQGAATAYVTVSIVGGIAAAWLGHHVTRAIVAKG
jgi:CrcB protein